MQNITLNTDTGFYLEGQSVLYDLARAEERAESRLRLEQFYNSLQMVLKPDVVFEVGAGSGDKAVRLHEKLPETQVIAFEGNPIVFPHITHKRLSGDDPTLQYIKRVIGQKEGKAFFVCRQNVDGPYSLDEARDFNPADSSVAKLAFNKELRTYSLNIWLNKLSEKTFSLRVNSHKMLYGILKGMEFKLFSADTLFLNVPAVQRWKWDWTQQDLITFMLEGGFKPLARDFPDAQTHYKMIFIRQDLADLPEVKKETKKFLTRFDESESQEEKASRWGKKKK